MPTKCLTGYGLCYNYTDRNVVLDTAKSLLKQKIFHWKGETKNLLKIQTMLCKEEEQIGTTADFKIYVYPSFNVH